MPCSFLTSNSVNTPTTTVALPAPTCHQGLQYAFYQASEGSNFYEIPYNPTTGRYTEVDSKVSEITSWSPTHTGVTYIIGGITNGGNPSNPPAVYDYVPGTGRSDFIAIDHRGYLYTVLAGTYTFEFVRPTTRSLSRSAQTPTTSFGPSPATMSPTPSRNISTSQFDGPGSMPRAPATSTSKSQHRTTPSSLVRPQRPTTTSASTATQAPPCPMHHGDLGRGPVDFSDRPS